jgi:stress response protein SCP2
VREKILEPNCPPGPYEADIARELVDRPCIRRLIQPPFRDRTIVEMARIHDIAVPGTISVVFGWIPIQCGEDDTAELRILVQLYDAHGRCVDRIIGGPGGIIASFFQKKKTDDGRVAFTNAGFELPLGLFKSEFFRDRWCVTLDLDRLPPDVWSVSFAAQSTRASICVHRFKRKFLRIMEPRSKVELELFNVRMQEESDRDDALLLGGLYFAQDLWTFAPVGKKFTCLTEIERDAPRFWNAELAARGPIHG